MVLSNGIRAWHPDITLMKELELFQKSRFRWIFGSKEGYEQQLKRLIFSPFFIRFGPRHFS